MIKAMFLSYGLAAATAVTHLNKPTVKFVRSRLKSAEWFGQRRQWDYRHIRIARLHLPSRRTEFGGEGAYFTPGEQKMLHWSLMFLIIALIAALLGFTGLAGAAAGIAKILFFVFLVIWLLAFVVGRRSI